MSVAKNQLAGLSREEKLELLAKLAARKARATEEPKRYPLSFAQERGWFLSRLDPESPAHSIFRCWRLRGAVDLDVLEAAMRDVVCRHGSLRTTFAEEDGESVQVVAPSSSAQAFLLDRRDLAEALRALDDEARDERLGELAAEESRRPFDLEHQHLVRVAVLRLADDDHALFLTLHHIIADGWSMGLLFRELRELYVARVEGRRPTLPELPIQVGDFAVWQRRKLDLDAQLDVWRDALDGAPTVLDVPADRPRPAIASLCGDHVEFDLDRELSERIRRFAKSHGATLFMVLLAGFQALLHRLTDQRDLLVGSPIANRQRNEIEGLIGSFANTIVLRSRLGAEWPSFVELLEGTKRQALAAYGHQDLPFERLVETLQPERDLSRNPLFQVMFSILDEDGGGRLELPGVEVSKVDVDRGLSKVDLTLEMVTGADGEAMSGYVEYATDLFDQATIERFIRRFVALLAAATAEPSRSIGALPILTDGERQRLDAINDTARADLDLDTPLHVLVERVGAAHPDAVAVVACDAVSVSDESIRRDVAEHTGSLTYRALLDRSARLARRLIAEHGIRRGDRVALCLERSIEAAVAFLAVLRAGAAYVPIDPSYPTERLRVTVEDCGARILLASARLADRGLGALLPDGVEILVLDRDFDALTADGDATPPAVDVSSLDVAYIIYTSGSTGRPKGVVVHHRAAANLAQTMVERFELTPDDRCLQFASLAFDVSFEEVFSTWLAGATVVMRCDHQSLVLA
ncbi:MAG: condensation domain-containing protein, partial [Acidobacteriota bacterium]